MIRNSIVNRYFEWMYNRVTNNRYCKNFAYRELLLYLSNKEFTYIIEMDANRAEDGIDLRYLFSCENNLSDSMVSLYLDDKPCSVLEMMVALSIKCEEIMENPLLGDCTSQWFWSMISSLGLACMTDGNFDEQEADETINKFLNREYSYFGEGGLFTVHQPLEDLRNVEIWCQMHWYLNEISEDE